MSPTRVSQEGLAPMTFPYFSLSRKGNVSLAPWHLGKSKVTGAGWGLTLVEFKPLIILKKKKKTAVQWDGQLKGEPDWEHPKETYVHWAAVGARPDASALNTWSHPILTNAHQACMGTETRLTFPVHLILIWASAVSRHQGGCQVSKEKWTHFASCPQWGQSSRNGGGALCGSKSSLCLLRRSWH